MHYGEGSYDQTEALIRQLLGLDGAATSEPSAHTLTADRTPETYLGAARMGPHTNAPVVTGTSASYRLDPAPPADTFSLGGQWTVQREYAEAGAGAELSLTFRASSVYLVLAGEGTVDVTVAGRTHQLDVSGAPALYTLYDGPSTAGPLHLSVPTGIQAYAFTFG